MAQSKNNVVTHGLSGKIGDMLLFRQRAGKTIVGKIPDRSNVEPSDKQKEVNEKFQQAVIYAKAAIRNPATKAAYEAAADNGKSAFNIAVADLFNAPDIREVDVSHYAGKVGDVIIISAIDDFKVSNVSVEIYKSDSTLIEKGDAVISEDELHWVYTCTAANDNMTGSKIIIQANDLPGNTTERQHDFS